MPDFKTEMREVAAQVDGVMDTFLPLNNLPEERVTEAMRYSTLAGGKRLRPYLVVETARIFGVDDTVSLKVGAALEMVHTYSLIHDDLPAMDDDDLRRGVPTCHKKYDEATAILAGDALLTKAFEVLADPSFAVPDVQARELSFLMAKAAGEPGMVGGQMLDILAPDLTLGLEDIIRLQNKKTGALFHYACEAGAIIGNATDEERQSLSLYADCLGLAFQIIDDLLDLSGTEEEMGKAVGKDVDAGKATIVSLMGEEAARKKAANLLIQAEQALAMFDTKASRLNSLMRYVVERQQ